MSLRTFFLRGPAGRIECLLKRPPGGAPPSAVCVLCHPHPLFGGTMHNKVVHAAARAVERAGLPVVRFNFRGAGLSEGAHDGGRGERDDLRAVLDGVSDLHPGLPLLLAGYSFGAWVGLRVGCADPRAAGLIGIGLPVSLYDFGFLGACGTPLALVQGDRDPYGPLPLLMALASAVPSGARILPVREAAHGFEGRLEELGRRVREGIPAGLLATEPGPPRGPA